MNRSDWIKAEGGALDKIARCNRALDTLRLLLYYFRHSPRMVRRLNDMADIVIAAKRAAQEARREASEHI